MTAFPRLNTMFCHFKVQLSSTETKVESNHFYNSCLTFYAGQTNPAGRVSPFIRLNPSSSDKDAFLHLKLQEGRSKNRREAVSGSRRRAPLPVDLDLVSF